MLAPTILKWILIFEKGHALVARCEQLADTFLLKTAVEIQEGLKYLEFIDFDIVLVGESFTSEQDTAAILEVTSDRLLPLLLLNGNHHLLDPTLQAAGFQDYISPPPTVDQLISRINHMIDRNEERKAHLKV